MLFLCLLMCVVYSSCVCFVSRFIYVCVLFIGLLIMFVFFVDLSAMCVCVFYMYIYHVCVLFVDLFVMCVFIGLFIMCVYFVSRFICVCVYCLYVYLSCVCRS